MTFLHPVQPIAEGYLPVSDKHSLYYATYGNPEGIPVVILHGGPGVGCKEDYTRFFDLKKWYVVMFDQRGAMRSKPFAEMEENTPQHTVEDVEKLRNHLKIGPWYVFGNSFGSCLALLYGEVHAESCLGFILEGLFLARDDDIRFFKDMGKYSPEAYAKFKALFSGEEQQDIPRACDARVMNSDPQIHLPMAREALRCMLQDSSQPLPEETIEKILADDRLVLSFMRPFIHYNVHGCFLMPNQILNNLHKITHLPCYIVQGTMDTVTFPRQALLLHETWPGSQLSLVEGAGHSCFEPKIVEAISNKIKNIN